jgi:hypothetical protein
MLNTVKVAEWNVGLPDANNTKPSNVETTLPLEYHTITRNLPCKSYYGCKHGGGGANGMETCR